MRVNSISNFSYANRSNDRKMYASKSVSNVKKLQFAQISFAGKNMWQIASFTPENNGLGLAEAKQGGEGVVGYEAVASMRKHEKVKVKLANGEVVEKPVDARSFMPFWEYNNPKGGYKFLLHKGLKANQLPDEMPSEQFYSANLGEDINTVAKKLNVPVDEISYVIQSKPNGVGSGAKSRYCILEPTSVSGKVTRLSEKTLGELEDIPYALFKISANNPSYNKLKGQPHYMVYTPYLARASKPYSYDAFGNVPFEAEIINSDWMRSLADSVHSKMNTAEFDYYDPASVWAHDRVAHTYGNHIANMSAAGNDTVNGLKVHITSHNPGRNYQGITDDLFKYQVVVGDATDAEAMKKLPDFELLKRAKQYGINSEQLSPRERQIVRAIMEPHLENFRDGAGTYNILKSGISAARLNPDNISTGTVSYTFAKEMKDREMYDAAKFLTDDYASIETKDVLNGSTPASLNLDNPNANFGADANNGFSKNKSGFTTFKYDGNNIEEVIAAREKNAKWFTNLLWEAGQKGQDELNKLFFNEAQIHDGHNVVGCLSPIKDGEVLVMGWGRADEQKGYPITVKGFLEFLKREDIPLETKQKVKVVIGGGPWNKSAADYGDIMNDYKVISELDGGIFKNNLMIVDGWFSNRFVGCATYGMFTSRREMCGITPLECKAAAVPYGATATGGPVDYTNELNGFLTKEPVERNPEYYGLSWKNSPQEIDAARVKKQATQVADIYKQMIEEHTNNRESYVAKCKKNIEELIDWHNNDEYNLGKSANRRYLDDIWEIEKGWEARSKTPLKRIVGKFGEFKDDLETMIHKTKSKPVKVILSIILGSTAIASGIYLHLYNQKTKVKTDSTETPVLNKAA